MILEEWKPPVSAKEKAPFQKMQIWQPQDCSEECFMGLRGFLNSQNNDGLVRVTSWMPKETAVEFWPAGSQMGDAHGEMAPLKHCLFLCYNLLGRDYIHIKDTDKLFLMNLPV